MAKGYVDAMNSPNSPAPNPAHQIPSWRGTVVEPRKEAPIE